MKHKSLKKEQFTAGKEEFGSGYFSKPEKNPLKFANSDELRKIQNRSRKRR